MLYYVLFFLLLCDIYVSLTTVKRWLLELEPLVEAEAQHIFQNRPFLSQDKERQGNISAKIVI